MRRGRKSRAACDSHSQGEGVQAALQWRVPRAKNARARVPFPLALLLGLASCGEAGEPQAGAAAECSGEFDLFAVGLTKQAAPQRLSVEIAAAEPAPPTVRSDNAWRLRVTDEDGAAVTGAELFATPYMPEHQHGSAEVIVSELAAGEYELAPIELIMPGVWEIPITVTPPAGVTSEAIFRFCIAER
jgi:hypothetical protein